MSVFVTGAAGFLGSAVVTEAAAGGREVLALHRPGSNPPAALTAAHVTPIAGDLRQDGPWRQALAGASEVIHCAAAASGDLVTQLGGTVLATETLLAALPEGLRRFVHVSSFSVYDFGDPGPFGTLNEGTAIERRALRRDAYTQTKLLQEEMVRAHCSAKGIELVVIRPGAIYGPGKDWDWGSAMKLGGFDLIFAPLARMRLVEVGDCARAIVAALDAPVEGELTVNVVAEEQPTNWAYHRQGKRAGAKVGTAVPVPYWAVRALGGAAWLASKMFFGGKARLPELLDLPRQEARWRPLRYSDSKARAALGWRATTSLGEGIARVKGSDSE